ncbi:MAG: cyclic nucleotide-binding domain-containing protein [Alphaproteobacteria bacterium]|nr:cyclic nucleotide-binding domain-containing protein [Alphaproteobacteria bacterium]
MSTALFEEACEIAKRHHGGLKPFFRAEGPRRTAGSRLVAETVAPAGRIVGPDTADHDLRFLVTGAAVVTQAVGGGKPQSVRNVNAPVSLGASAFALGSGRTASVVAMRPCQVLRLSRAGLKDIARDSPTIAVGLLRWAALDVIDWLRESRQGNDAWSLRQNLPPDQERAFESVRPKRTMLDIDAQTQAAVMDSLAELKGLEGASLLPLAEALGTHVHLALVKSGEPVLSHDERDGALYLLLDGQASVRGRTGRVLGRFRGGGEAHEVLLGEVAWLAQGGRDGTVTADTDCILLVVPREATEWMLVKHGPLAVAMHLAVLQTLCRRIHEVDQLREEQAP